MPLLQVPFLPDVNKDSDVCTISKLLEGETKHKINIASWPGYSNTPDVSFQIAYGNECLLLKYTVIEKEIRIVYQRPNDPVYKDSCVEFFIAFDEENAYYNFEFNSIGTCLAAFGPNRNERKYLSETAIEKIRYQTVVRASNSTDRRIINWELTIVIPIDVFSFHSFTTLNRKKAFANFYKCGDELQEPHYLSWAPITSAKPDFHLKEFFGAIEFT